jgi:site-specific DNA-methyltransferase (adenine-specific)
MEIIISSCTDEGDLVFEPFGGLCTAAIAAHKLNRHALSVEKVPDFYRESVKRLETYDAAA